MSDKSTFAPGLALLPGQIKADVHSLYRVLRSLDDLVDEDDPRAPERVQAVEAWARAGAADSPTDPAPPPKAKADLPTDPSTYPPHPPGTDTPETRALADLASRHSLPRESLLEFCEGMRHDIARASIEDDEDFERYCRQAGGSVGVVLANLLGAAGEDGESRREVERRMATLGRAMQVTNILRDIDEDLAHGRIYIAQTAIERFGFPSPGAREALLRDHIARADALYEDGLGAIALLRDGRRAMALSASLYREILRQIERDGFGRRPGRAVVPVWRRRVLLARHRFAQL
jgi:phytoene synthase